MGSQTRESEYRIHRTKSPARQSRSEAAGTVSSVLHRPAAQCQSWPSQDLINTQFHVLRPPNTFRREHVPVQPEIIFRAGLKPRRTAEVNQRGIHWLPTAQLLHCFRWSMPQAVVVDVDQRPVIRLNRVTRLEFAHAISAHHLNIRPEGQNPPADLRTAHFTA